MHRKTRRATDRTRRHAHLLLLLAGGGLAMAGTAQAIITDYTLGVLAEYTDNIGLTDSNTEDEIPVSLLAGFGVRQAGAELDADIRGLLDYRNYLQDTYGDERLGYLSGAVEWRPMPDLLHLVAEDYFTQTVANSLAPETPTNRISANAFTIGPDVFLRLAPATTLETRLRRSEYYFEDTNADSSRNAIAAGVVRAIRPQLAVSANIAYEDAKFSESSVNDFTRLDYFLRGEFERGRTELTVDAGISDIDRSGARADVDGFLGRLILARQIRTNARVDLELSSQYTDSGVDLLTAGSGPFEFDRFGEQVSGDIFRDNRIEARYHAGTSDHNWGVYLLARDEDYEVLPQDRKSFAVQLEMRRGISESTFVNAFARYRRDDYSDLAVVNKDSELGLGMERRLTRQMTARLDYVFNTRDSDTAGFDYEQNRVLLLLYYGSDPELFR